MSVVLYKMKSVGIVYDMHIWDFLDAHEDVAGASPNENVDIVLTSPLYNVKNEHSIDTSSNDILMAEDMSDFVELERQLMATEAHEHAPCSWMQFP